MSRTFKVKFQPNEELSAETRRFTLFESELNLETLRDRTRKIFGLDDSQVWYFKWLDEEEDMVSLTEEYELQDFLSTNSSPLLKLQIYQPPPPQNSFEMDDLHMRALKFARCGGQQGAFRQELPQFAAVCDVTNKPLSIGDGEWFHKRGSNYDLCFDEFVSLSDQEKTEFVQVCTVDDLEGDKDIYRTRRCPFFSVQSERRRKCGSRRGHCNRACGEQTQDEKSCKSGGSRVDPEMFMQVDSTQSASTESANVNANATSSSTPASCKSSKSKCHRQQNDRVETAATRIMEAAISAAQGQFSSPVGWCDATRRRLTPGSGWYHQPGTTNDFCVEAFSELDDATAKKFVLIQSPNDLGSDLIKYSRPSFNRVAQDFLSLINPALEAAGLNVELAGFSPCDAQQQQQSQQAENSQTPSDSQDQQSKPKTPLRKRGMKVVGGPSIVAGSQVSRGSKLTPVWEVTNLDELDINDGSDWTGVSGWWTDVRVRPVANKNPFNVPSEGFEVPMIENGGNGLVTVELTVPDNLNGPVEAEFQLVDSDGAQFGPPLVINVNVSSPPVEREAELVELLQNMGFVDRDNCVRAIRDANGDANKAAIALLRAIRK